MSGPSYVLDSSALLALLRNEPGADRVEVALRSRAAMSAVNWAETLSKLADGGEEPSRAAARIKLSGVIGAGIGILPLDELLAVEIASLRASTSRFGLSLGDRACIALGRALGLPILTADLAWSKLRVPGVTIEIVR